MAVLVLIIEEKGQTRPTQDPQERQNSRVPSEDPVTFSVLYYRGPVVIQVLPDLEEKRHGAG